MANFITLDDIDNLSIIGRYRLDKTGKYDISYYENYINENINILEELLGKVNSLIDTLTDDNVKKRLLSWSKYLVKTYEINKSKKVKEEYEQSPYSSPTGAGYLQTNKYAKFIERDFANLVSSYSNVINFMYNVYDNAKVLSNKGSRDASTLDAICYEVKKSCSKLGIHCPPADILYDSITEDPYNENGSALLEWDVIEVEENNLNSDIIINSLPYSVTCPLFTWEGPGKYECTINHPKASIAYNSSFLEKKHL